jgi:protein-L-isoaspartate(D-aspartate) O-methyltransferase
MAKMVAPDEKSKGRAYGIEYIKELIPISLENLKKDSTLSKMLDEKQIVIQHGDGWKGLPEEGPFNAIHVGAAAKGFIINKKLIFFPRNTSMLD